MSGTNTGPRRRVGAEPVLTPAAERILAAASDLFYARGITAVGVELIAERAGVTKKTLYDRFGSKAALVAAYLHARDRRWRDFLTGYVDAHAGTPRERVLAVFAGLAAWQDAHHDRGCGFVNAHAELTDPDHPAVAVVRAQKAWLVGYLTDLVTAAGAADPDGLAAALLLLHEGACVVHGIGAGVGGGVGAGGTGGTRAASEAAAAAAVLLTAALPPPGSGG